MTTEQLEAADKLRGSIKSLKGHIKEVNRANLDHENTQLDLRFPSGSHNMESERLRSNFIPYGIKAFVKLYLIMAEEELAILEANLLAI